jgi:uncharacterized membrane protein
MEHPTISIPTRLIQSYSCHLVSLFIISIVIIISSTSDVEAARDYGPEHWSEDFQMTHGDAFSYQYHEMLNIEEQTTGMLSLTFENSNRSSPAMIQWMETDKLGGSQSGWDDSVSFPKHDPLSATWFISRRAWSFHYDESRNSIQLFMKTYNQEFGIFEFDSKGDLILERHISLDEFYSGAVQSTLIGDSIESVWDSQGVAHCVFSTIERLDKDNIHILRACVYYTRISWHPFFIQFEKIYEIQRYDDTMMRNRIPNSLIGIDNDSRVVVAFIKKIADNYYRTLGIRNLSGNWTFLDLGKVRWNYFGVGTFYSGLFIDNQDVIHVAWVSPGPYLTYAKATTEGIVGVGAKDITLLTNHDYIDMVRVDMDITSDGDMIFTINDNPYTASNLQLGPGNSEIHIFVLPGDDIASGRVVDHLIVDIPTATEAELLEDRDGNLFLFWFDQRSGMTELYMRYLARPGITFTFDPIVWAMASTIRPGETKVIPMEVRNVGTVEYDVAIYPDTNASYLWEIWLDRYDAHLDAHKGIPVNLTVTCPLNASDGESVIIWINATTSDRELWASVYLTIFVKWRRALEVHCTPSHHMIDSGGWAYYNVLVHNIGEIIEGLEVTVTGTGSTGWYFSPVNASLELSPDEVAIVELSVGAPPDARSDDIFTLLLEFKWTDGSFAHPGLVLRTVIRPTFFVTMELNESTVILRPGEERYICATVANEGNLQGTAFIEVSIITDPGEWQVLLAEETITLKSGEHRNVVMVLIAPSHALGGEILVVRVRAYSVNPFSEVDREVMAQVQMVHSIETIDTLRWDLYPLEESSVDFNIANNGNLYETIWLKTYGISKEWTLWVEDDGVMTDSIRIPPNEDATVDIWVSAPATAQAGRYSFRLFLEIDGTAYSSIEIEIHVKQVFNVYFSAWPEESNVYPGGTVQLGIDLTNYGNGDDYLYPGFLGEMVDYGRFVFDQRENIVYMPYESEIRGTFLAHIHNETKPGLYSIELIFTSKGNPEFNVREEVTIYVVTPEVVVSNVEAIPSQVQVNQVITLIITLYNPGDLQVVNVTLIFMDGTKEDLSVIGPDGTAQAVFTWVPKRDGPNRILGQITYEPGSQEESWEAIVDVQSEGENEAMPYLQISHIIMIAFISSALVIIALVVRRYQSQ